MTRNSEIVTVVACVALTFTRRWVAEMPVHQLISRDARAGRSSPTEMHCSIRMYTATMPHHASPRLSLSSWSLCGTMGTSGMLFAAYV